ncbi:AIR synthase-related protein [Acidianus sp. HS-5]|uniref:AIR synthase-related protein n=1 Tax=Acidianus sp. HS-5 TaxID=2886040 RepID=UPI001F2CF7B1|nr:AIR synthase-related protein [Acidianus sp. HS-5]BDC19150.1 AIR synthase [Acidianus sp. HS-5]
MVDLEGIARRLPKNEARKEIIKWLEFYKGKRDINEKIADSIIIEVENSKKSSIYEPTLSGIRAGDAGLGSRGIGDHIIHEKILEIAGKGEFEDAGLSDNIIASIDGIHSRLSYFPFLAGFHVTKATLRDIMVKGAEPIGVIVDIHLADDTDVSYLLDFEAGVTTVTDFLGIIVLAGSTLRIGGDLVLGERISGGVGAIGKLKSKFFARHNVREGMKIIMTQGNGGGTITATAIYYGFPEVVEETLRLDELLACKVISDNPNLSESMTDVTNGGLRMDAIEISESRKLSFVIDPEKFLHLINPRVLKMFDELQIDPFGISIDSILIFTNEEDKVLDLLARSKIKADVVGYVSSYKDYPILTVDGKKLEARFRESPYTPVKKVIGNYSPYTIDDIKGSLSNAVKFSKIRKENVLKNLKSHFA